MNVNIIRGKNQIGGNIIEISTEKTKILLDAGIELDDEMQIELPDIPGLFGYAGYDVIFISHYHGDHLGLVYKAHKDIPLLTVICFFVNRKRNTCQLFGSQAKCGYDWWWHSFTAHHEKTNEEKAFFIEYFLCNPKEGKDGPAFGQLGEKRHNRLWNGGNGKGIVKLYHRGRLADEVLAENAGCEYGEYDI